MQRIGKLLALVLVMTLVVGAAGAGEKYRLAYIARAQGDSFAAWLANAIREEVEKNYPDMTVTVFDGQSSNEIISTHIENAITNKYDAVLLQPFDPQANSYPMFQAVDAGLVGACVNVTILDPRLGNVDANPFDQAAVNCELALKQIPQNANVVVLLGPAGNPHSLERRRAWQEVFFDKRPDVKIVGEQIANWNKDEAMRYMEDWIQATGGKIDAICSMNDNMCAGALEAAKDAGLKNLLAYGVDGTAEACLLIKSGEMTSTSLQSAYDLASASVKMVHDMLNGGKPSLVMIDCPLIVKDNVDQFIEMHKRAGAL
ncbi:MAG: sugar ABC transporter substrate-binding protein [Planctomycetota bacterium]|jgi:inositol transport system substrate-binding protein|nr:sugar ABC transporter substrate-binding protein [Planctomycetota bacterium]